MNRRRAFMILAREIMTCLHSWIWSLSSKLLKKRIFSFSSDRVRTSVPSGTLAAFQGLRISMTRFLKMIHLIHFQLVNDWLHDASAHYVPRLHWETRSLHGQAHSIGDRFAVYSRKRFYHRSSGRIIAIYRKTWAQVMCSRLKTNMERSVMEISLVIKSTLSICAIKWPVWASSPCISHRILQLQLAIGVRSKEVLTISIEIHVETNEWLVIRDQCYIRLIFNLELQTSSTLCLKFNRIHTSWRQSSGRVGLITGLRVIMTDLPWQVWAYYLFNRLTN